MSGPQSTQGVTDHKLVPLGYQQIDTLNAAKGLTLPDKAQYALIQPQTQDVRWRDDGTDPTSAVGIVLAAGDDFFYTGDLSAIKFIETAASAKINVSYYGW